MNTTEVGISQLKEITDRTRRVETRLHLLCEHLGLVPKVPTEAPYRGTPEDEIFLMHNTMRRIETSLHQLREHVGMPDFAPTSQPIVDKRIGAVNVSGYDVTLAAIRGALLSASAFETSVPFIIHINGEEVADLIFTAP